MITGAKPSFTGCVVDAANERNNRLVRGSMERTAPSTLSLHKSAGRFRFQVRPMGEVLRPPPWESIIHTPNPVEPRGCLRGAQPPSFGVSRRGFGRVRASCNRSRASGYAVTIEKGPAALAGLWICCHSITPGAWAAALPRKRLADGCGCVVAVKDSPCERNRMQEPSV